MLSPFIKKLSSRRILRRLPITVILSLILGNWLGILAVHAGDSDNTGKKESSAKLLADKIATIRTYHANFEQRVFDEFGVAIDTSSGTFLIQRPSHFRWQFKQPFSQLIIADGRYLWTYDEELEQVTIQDQDKMVANSPLLLLTSNETKLSQAFTISHSSPGGKKLLFELKPKQAESLFDRMNILFVNDEISELLMLDSLGQQTSVKFLNAKVNPKISPEQFTFIIPEGVDVVDSRQIHPVEAKQSPSKSGNQLDDSDSEQP
ncbi:outer membrane lipoprotein chaperone LolA [Aliikangiella maris]|uniref:Outer-membrane lipoprotein carrier protein n=2 Tax=Aliikangiella maris TaxID=3162458 RepID=A0ABV2BZ86_9GAMM